MKYCFDIDEKSLFEGVKNDYKNGQSATISTPLNQSKDKKKWRNDIYDFLEAYPSENIDAIPALLLDRCLRQTTSKAKSKIVYFYVFSKFTMDSVPIEVDSSFAIYVKEELDTTITDRKGNKVANTHCGRQKLHYPKSLYYQQDGFNINNKKVLESIIQKNGGFAYVVNGFDIDTDTKTLNFRTTMIGVEGVLLSNVFMRKKGVGVKLLVDGISLEKKNIKAAKDIKVSKEEANSFFDTLEKIKESCRKNGNIGEESVIKNINKVIEGNVIENVVHVSKKYPQSPYDIECMVDGKKQYIEVKSTASSVKTFLLSRGERKFMEKYEKNYVLILVTNVNSNHRSFSKYERRQIMNEKIMKQELQGIKFIVK